jgi:sugar lactone lactonase YvrE
MKNPMKNVFLASLCAIIMAISMSACKNATVQNADAGDDTVQLIAQGSPIHGANGINVDQNDELYVASVVSQTIFHLDKENGAVKQEYSSSDSILGPDDLTFGPDGSLYWTDILNGQVGRRTPDGIVTKQFVAPGTNPITFSDDGRLFVALDFLGDGLYELDPNLSESPRLILPELGWLNAMDWGPDGRLYGPIWSKGQVVRINVDTGDLEVVSDQVEVPAAVKFDSGGTLHVLDQKTGHVSQVDLNTGELTIVASIEPGVDNLVFDSQDRLFISHAQDGSVIEVMEDGSARDIVPGGIIAAGGITLVTEGDEEDLFISDLFTLRKINKTTGAIEEVTRHFIGLPGLISPFTASSHGNQLILTSWFDNAVQVWNSQNGKSLEEYRDYAIPINAISYNGQLIVAELGAAPGQAQVSLQNEDGRKVLADANLGITVPSGLAANEGNLWVADWALGSISQLIKDDVILDVPIEITGGLSQPEGLAVAPDGALLVVETGTGQVTRIELHEENGEQHTHKSTLAEGLDLGIQAIPGTVPTWIFSGIAVSKDGSIYVAGDKKSQILKINS